MQNSATRRCALWRLSGNRSSLSRYNEADAGPCRRSMRFIADECRLSSIWHASSFGCQVRILSIEFSIPYLLNDENYPIGGWAIELSIWLRALEAAGHEPAILTWKGAL